MYTMIGLAYGSIEVHKAQNVFISLHDNLSRYITKHVSRSVPKTYKIADFAWKWETCTKLRTPVQDTDTAFTLLQEALIS
jgi:hypothetical protein